MNQPAVSEAPQKFDSRELRNAFGRFTTGVTVVTCLTPDGKPHGATVNAFTAVSLDPPLAQVTLIRGNKASQYLEDQSFAINILAEDQLDVCLNFAGRPMTDGPEWRNEDGIPVLKGNAATIECKPWRTYDGGDHVIVIGEVIDVEVTDRAPLLFHAGKFRSAGSYLDGLPWDCCGDGLSIGWFGDNTSFRSF